MKKEDGPLHDGHQLGAAGVPLDESTRYVAAFSRTSAIALAVYDNQLRFQVVNDAAAATAGHAPEAFIGNTLRDMIGDAAPETEARFHRVLVAETPPVEVSVMLPSRSKLGYWIEKQFTINNASGRVTQVASLAVEVTANRELEERFCKLGGEPLWKNQKYQPLAQELHDSISQYHEALGMSLDRLSRWTKNPEKIPELLTHSLEFLDERMQKLASAIARCFPIEQH